MKKNYSFHGVLPCSKILIFLLIILSHNLSAQYGASDDFDLDGISNYDDIDDDNDGILDYIECQPVSTIKRYNDTGNAIWNGATTITATRSNTTNITAENGTGSVTDINRIITGSAPSVYTNNYKITATRESFWLMNADSVEDQRGSVTFTYSTPIPISQVLIVLQDVDYRTNGGAPTITITVSGGTATTQDLAAYKVRNLDLPNPNNANNGGYNATTGVISYNVPLRGVDTNDNRAFALVGNSSATVKTIRVSYELDEKAEVFIGRVDTPCDQDNDGISNNFDLDSDGDGCPDAVEAGVADYAGAAAMQSGSIQNGSNGAVTSTRTVVESVVSGPYGTNGFAASVENNDTFAADYKNTAGYTYSSAINSGVVVCCSNFTAGTLSGAQNICTGSTTSFSSTQSGGTWSSSNTSIATVSATGVVTGVSAGTATITYTYDKYNGTCAQTATRTVTITAVPNAGTLSGTQSICAGSKSTFTTTGQTGGTWSSSNTSIATVSTTGVVTGVSAGTTTITYTVAGTGGCADSSSTRTITVTAAPNAGTLSGTQNICAGSTSTFTTTGQTGGTWSSSNTSIATVSTTGVVTGVSAGTATITYTVTGTGGCADSSSTRTITVTAAPSAGTLSGTQNICAGSTSTFTTTGQTGGAWSSSNTSIATVSTTGVVTGVSAGTATITYTVTGTGGCADSSSTRTITVTAAPNAGTLSGTQNICVGSASTFTTTGQTGGTWSSSNTSIATVSTIGVVTGVSAGTATITYTVTGTGGCSNASATRTVAVTLCSCYKPGAPATAGSPALISKVGVSSLLRNNSQQIQDNWPASRNGAWLVMEARTKGFVVNRMAFNASGNPVNILPANFVEGMLVYDLTNKCLKMYTSQDSGATFGWYCISTQTCPD
ncbi:beta strand repeat-containing protein [Chryseobacterium angstadtii]|uniref:beta strand repeat-containing protein n=1 Tax=Chryseobacterium angstadtii TaxID=558151 RepID=UPI00065AD7E3|nr:Ig-like domain-containing protein [Chryseobacterium angstadtii]